VGGNPPWRNSCFIFYVKEEGVGGEWLCPLQNLGLVFHRKENGKVMVKKLVSIFAS